MTTTYPFEQFSHAAFQQFTCALFAAVFGPVLEPMGPGSDGGRDLFTRDALRWGGSEHFPAFDWHGYSVVQVKQKERLEKPYQDANWLIAEIRSELDDWDGGTDSRTPVPDQILFVTNVPLSAKPGTGGIDKVSQEIQTYLAAKREAKSPMGRVRDVRVWSRYMLDALVGAHESVRHEFVGLLTVGDVLSLLAQVSGELPQSEIEPALRAHARRALLDESWVYFREAGGNAGERTPVSDVVVDLPVVSHATGARSTILQAVLERAAMNLRIAAPYVPNPRHLVVAGAPGNGKTTISQFIAQTFRSSFLFDDSLVPQYRTVVEGTNTALQRLGQHRPGQRRWPIRIDLAKYVQEGRHQTRFLRSIAELISAQSDSGAITATNIYGWMRAWPWLVVFDGLDEVANAATRNALIAEIEGFVASVDEQNADVLVVVTTRPSGYDDELDPLQFERLDLDYLSLKEAIRYGELVTRTRLSSDRMTADHVVGGLRAASKDPNLQLLMRTPLQVAILSIILEGGQPPADRYGLFWDYYGTVLKRERGKPTGFAQVLKKHANVVTRLHERVGFLLQAHSEIAEGSSATIRPSELERLLRDDLTERGFDLEGNDLDLLDEVNEAGTKRLLLLAPKDGDNLGFDVRPMQELMAARHLTNGDDNATTTCLRRSAPSPHWRNTWLFAAGRIFGEDAPHRQQNVLDLLSGLDTGAHSRLGSVNPVGPYLALELVGEGIAGSVPRMHADLLKKSLKILDQPFVSDSQLVAQIWVNEARRSESSLGLIVGALEAAVAKSDAEARAALTVIRDIAAHVQDTHYLTRVKNLGAIQRKHGTAIPLDPQGRSLEETAKFIVGVAGDDHVAALVEAFLTELRSPTSAETPEAQSSIEAALADPEAAEIVDVALQELSVDSRAILTRALRHVQARIQRTPVGAELDSKNLLRFLNH